VIPASWTVLKYIYMYVYICRYVYIYIYIYIIYIHIYYYNTVWLAGIRNKLLSWWCISYWLILLIYLLEKQMLWSWAMPRPLPLTLSADWTAPVTCQGDSGSRALRSSERRWGTNGSKTARFKRENPVETRRYRRRREARRARYRPRCSVPAAPLRVFVYRWASVAASAPGSAVRGGAPEHEWWRHRRPGPGPSRLHSVLRCFGPRNGNFPPAHRDVTNTWWRQQRLRRETETLFYFHFHIC